MSYNILRPFQLLTAQSLGANFNSPAVEVRLQDNIGFQFTWIGTPVGNFGVEVSMNYYQDPEGNITNAGTWIPLTLSPVISAAGSGDSAYIDLNQLSAPYARLTYVRTSGTGSVNVFATAKGV